MSNGSISSNVISNIFTNDYNNNGTIYVSMDKSKSREKCIEQSMETNNCKTLDANHMIYRYKFTEDIQQSLYEFSKIHEYDNRHEFKEAWELWKDDNRDIILMETRRLSNLGYNGDCLNKMFKSARYYFRKKSTIQKEQKKRSTYVKIDKELLNLIDNHIHIDNKPSIGFNEFYEKYNDIIHKEFEKVSSIISPEDFEIKIKKTYKNRYFLYIQNNL